MTASALREIRSSFGRFMAILSIIALGVGFFTGVRITTPAMVNTVGGFMTDHELFDYRIISTLGWEDKDVDKLKEREDVRAAEGAYALDLLCLDEAGEEHVFKTHSLTDDVNRPDILEGRLPKDAGECVIDGKTAFKVGDKLTVSVDIKNTGKRAGKEVVQLYIGERNPQEVRPLKELKGFDKVDLQPGETKTVSFEISKDQLQYFSAKSHDWTVDDATFDAYVCASSEDVRGKVTFNYKK